METLNKLSNSKEIKQLIEKLGSKKGTDRVYAREQLVSHGQEVADFLIELLKHSKHIYRKEALKTLEEIESPDFIPIFLEALEDDESDIRWIGAKGLIRLGESSIKPLLKLLIEKSDSVFVLSGAHHVFYDLRKANNLPPDFPVNKLLDYLKNPELRERIKTLAYELLNNSDL